MTSAKRRVGVHFCERDTRQVQVSLAADTASVSVEEAACLFLFVHHSAAQQPHLLSVCRLHARNSPDYRSRLFRFSANTAPPKRSDIFGFSDIFADTIKQTFLLSVSPLYIFCSFQALFSAEAVVCLCSHRLKHQCNYGGVMQHNCIVRVSIVIQTGMSAVHGFNLSVSLS